MHEKIIIFDYGSQYTQLIARRVRECGVYSEIVPFSSDIDLSDHSIKGIILSGSPCSSLDSSAPDIYLDRMIGVKPILAICYSAQYAINYFGGSVQKSAVREYGRAKVKVNHESPLFHNIPEEFEIWMSHSDSIEQVSHNMTSVATTHNNIIAAYQSNDPHTHFFGLQFHPEVSHSDYGSQIFSNFVLNICNCIGDWTPKVFIDEQVDLLTNQIGDHNVILGLSGGVDSSVTAYLLHRAIGKQLYCIFIDNGLLRYHEYEEVLQSYISSGLNVIGVDAKSDFYDALKGLTEPEAKRKAIGRTFIEVFERESKKIPNVKFLAQGTIYPDVIESVSVNGPSVTIKSHHNVGGLPDKLGFELVEPLRLLFKDEVREVGKVLGVPIDILMRHPFPGPGLAIRILGEVTPQKVELLQGADHIFTNLLRQSGWYDRVWQSGTILLPIHSVGVMGDERTYEQVVALRCVHSVDGMTADWVHLPYDLLAKISNEIINQIKGINRVVYDISSKPPATIEWE